MRGQPASSWSGQVRVRVDDHNRTVTPVCSVPARQPVLGLQGLLGDTSDEGCQKCSLTFVVNRIPLSVPFCPGKQHCTRASVLHTCALCALLLHAAVQVANGKPAPDVFVAAAQQLGVDPKQCLCFEDAPSGVAVSVPSVLNLASMCTADSIACVTQGHSAWARHTHVKHHTCHYSCHWH